MKKCPSSNVKLRHLTNDTDVPTLSVLLRVSTIHHDMNKVKKSTNQRLAHSCKLSFFSRSRLKKYSFLVDDYLAQAVQLLYVVDQAKSKIDKLMKGEFVDILSCICNDEFFSVDTHVFYCGRIAARLRRNR